MLVRLARGTIACAVMHWCFAGVFRGKVWMRMVRRRANNWILVFNGIFVLVNLFCGSRARLRYPPFVHCLSLSPVLDAHILFNSFILFCLHCWFTELVEFNLVATHKANGNRNLNEKKESREPPTPIFRRFNLFKWIRENKFKMKWKSDVRLE